jgi:predicted PolB exonuclease-like 3'-5' exonuclease
MHHLIFDIETVPDFSGLRNIMGKAFSTVDDHEVLRAYWKQKKPDDDLSSLEALQKMFLPVHLHRVVTIGVGMLDDELETFQLMSLHGGEHTDEATILQQFFKGITKYTPQLVSWNGSGFDLPVLHHRAMIHRVTAGRYWDWGDGRNDFRYNNYLNRYHTRHLDLMDVLAAFNGKNFTKLDDMAKLCGLPGKHGMGGAEVAPAFAAGRIDDICRYCEADVLNTTLLYLRFLWMSERMDSAKHQRFIGIIKAWVEQQKLPFWQEVLDQWRESHD